MDLRTKRTLLSIKEAFFKLRQTTELSKIKVTKLCEIAMINKATFYNYYESIDHLVDTLDNELIEQIFIDLKQYASFSDNKTFLLEINKNLKDKKEKIQSHFKERQNVLFYKLIDRIKNQYIEMQMPKEEIIKTTFLLSGGLISILYFIFYENYDPELVTSTLSEILTNLEKN